MSKPKAFGRSVPVSRALNDFDFVVVKQPADIPEGLSPSAIGAIDRMREEICSQVQAEIQLGFDNLSAKLIHEIQTLPPQGLVQRSPREKSFIDKSKSRRTTSRDNQGLLAGGAGMRTGEDEGTRDSQAVSQNKSFEKCPSEIVRYRSWRSAVVKDINKQQTSLTGYLNAVMTDIRNRSLEDVAMPDNCCVSLVSGKIFSALSFLLIVVNAVWMGYESDTELEQQRGQEWSWPDAINMGFTLWFALELILRVSALRKYFFFGDDWTWNWLDLALVVTSIPELFAHSMNVSFVRLIRLAKLSKALRLVRMVKFISSLREILISVFYTLGSLFWSFVALSLISYIFALFFMQSLAIHVHEGKQYSHTVTNNFSSTWNTMLALFSMVTGGQDWYEVAQEFQNESDHMSKYSLVLYVFFTSFGLMNVIIGVFCARATEASRSDDHLRVAKEKEQRSRKVKDLIHIFNEIDTRRSGNIDHRQFLAYFEKPKAQEMLQSHGLQLFDHQKIWSLMDSYDGNADGLVDLPGFVMGVMRLAGEAKSTELVMLSMQVDHVLHSLKQLILRLSSKQLAPCEKNVGSSLVESL